MSIASQIGLEDCAPFGPTPAHIVAYHYLVTGRLFLQLDGESPIETGVSARTDPATKPREDVNHARKRDRMTGSRKTGTERGRMSVRRRDEMTRVMSQRRLLHRVAEPQPPCFLRNRSATGLRPELPELVGQRDAANLSDFRIKPTRPTQLFSRVDFSDNSATVKQVFIRHYRKLPVTPCNPLICSGRE
jgi:hypothetical protein